LANNEKDFLHGLVAEMHDLLINYANIRLCDLHSSYDAVQETYLAAQKNIFKLMKSENPQGWLIETLKYKVMHEKRAKARFFLLTQTITNEGMVSISNIDIDEYGIIEKINKDDYQILKSVYVYGYSIKEIAAELEITYEACKKRVQAAKRRLAQELED